MSTTETLSPIDAAADHLDNAKRVLADANATVQRLTARERDLTAELQAAEHAAIAAAAAVVPDDGSTARALADVRTRHAANQSARALHEAAVTAGEQTVRHATNALALAHAHEELRQADELVTPFERAVDALIEAHAGIAEHIRAARQHAGSTGTMLDVPAVIGRRLRHVLMAAGINVNDEGPALPSRDARSAAGAIRAAIQNPRWGGV